MLTEDQIERRVENATDRLDKRFTHGEITEAEYNCEYAAIAQWAMDQYRALRDSGSYRLSRDET